MNNIDVFASGNGTNAENIITHFSASNNAVVKLVITNKADAYVLERARAKNVPAIVLPREELTCDNPTALLETLKQHGIEYIILAGYLLKIPAALTENYKGKILNIHPALLPKFGGKGMYGMHVHRAVIEAREAESGITIHLVDAVYDNGKILFQATCPVLATDTPEQLAAKVQELEQTHFPTIIEKFITGEIK